MSIYQDLSLVKKNIPKNVTLVAVSKTKPNEFIQEAYNAGQRIFGENKVQEMVEKHDALPKDIEWHLIGHLQKNKVKYMASFVSLIHGVGNLSCLIEINKQAKKHNRIIKCLLQAKIAQEETKFGLSFSEIETILNSNKVKLLDNIEIIGVMGMASFTDNQDQIKKEFQSLKSFYETTQLKALSMGMSGDYQLAIQEGSTMVRIGSAIFGSRL